MTARLLRDHPCSRGNHLLSNDMHGKNKRSARNLADRFPQDYSSLQSNENHTDNVLPSDVRERKSEVIDIGIDKFATHSSLIFREWEFRYVRTSITKVEIMLAITVWASILLIAFTATLVDIYYAVLKNENGGKQVVDHS